MAPRTFDLLRTEFLDNVCYQALKAIYGLADAPALWREAVHRTLTELVQCEQSSYDECLYLRRNALTQKVELMISPLTERSMSVTSSGRSSINRTIRKTSG